MWKDLRLTFEFWPLVVRVRWQLWRAPLASCSKAWQSDATRALEDAKKRNAPSLEPLEVWQRAHAIKRAARLVPGASCLTQALALQSVLSRCGERSSLVLGVDTNNKAKFQAHAWIEWRNRVLIGGPVERWKPLLTVAPQIVEDAPVAPTSKASAAPAIR